MVSPDSADKLLEAQAATGHIIDPKNNQKLTVEEACSKGVVDIRDRDKLLAAEAAAGTGAIAGVETGPSKALSFTEAKKQKMVSPDSADKLLEAQAATGHIIDPKNNQKLTVEEACSKGLVDIRDRDKLLAAEAAAVGYKDPTSGKPISVFEAMKKGLIDNKTGLRLLQAQESAGGILDPIRSVFLPKDEAIKQNLLDEKTRNALKQSPKSYTDPETEHDVTYEDLKEKCTIDPKTGQKLLKVSEKIDPSNLIFDGVRKPVTAEELLNCGILDKPTFIQLMKGEKTIPEVSEEKKVFLKGTGSIAGVEAGPSRVMSFTEAKKQKLVSPDSADKLLEAQAATGHIIDPKNNQKLIVEEACSKGVVDIRDRDKLLAAEAAAVGYKDPTSAKPLSVFEAMKKGLIDNKTGLRLLQAQESAGGILDPIRSVFLPKEEAIKQNLLDEKTCGALKQSPKSYIDPETEHDVSYEDLKEKCTTDPKTGQKLLKVSEKIDPSKLIFDGVRKPVTAEELLDCGILDKPTFNKLMKGEKTIPEVAEEKKVFLKGTGSIAGVETGPSKAMSFTEAKKQKMVSPDSADKLLEAQAATGHIIDPKNNQKLTVEEACSKGVVDIRDRDKLLAAEAAAVGYRDPTSAKPLSVFEAMKKGLIDDKTGLRLLQAQESAGGILDPIRSVFLPKDEAIKHKLLDEKTYNTLKQSPKSYIDPETEHDVSYEDLKEKCTTEPKTGQKLLKISEKINPSNLIFDGVRKPVKAEELLDSGPSKAMSFTEAKKQNLLSPDSADKLLEAQAATGHIIDPKNNQKLTVEEACSKGVVDIRDRDKLLAAEAAAVGYKDPVSAEPLSVFEAMKKKLIDNKTGLRLLQDLKEKCTTDPKTGQKLLKGEKSVEAGPSRAMSFTEAKKQKLMSPDSADKLLEAQAATGHIIDPKNNQKLTVEEACSKGVVDIRDRDKLLAAEAAAVGYKDPVSAEPLSVFEAMKKGLIDNKTGLRLLQAQESVGGILDPIRSVFLPKDEAIKRNILDEKIRTALKQSPKSYIDPQTEHDVSYEDLKEKCTTDPKTGQKLLKVSERIDPSKLIFDGVRKPVTAEELLDCGILDKPTFNKLLKGEKTIPEVAKEKKVFLKGTGSIAGVEAGPSKAMSFTDAKKQKLISPDSADKLLEAQAATGHIIDPKNNQTLTVEEACSKGVVDIRDRDKLLAAEAAAVGYKDPVSAEPLAVFEAMKKGLIDSKTGLRLLQAQESVGGILDPIRSVFLPKDEAIKHKLLDEKTCNALKQSPKSYIDPETEHDVSYEDLKEKCTMDPKTGQKLLKVSGKINPSDLIFEGVRKPVTAEELLECGILDKPTFNKLMKGKKTIPEVAEEKKVFLKGTGSIAGVNIGPSKTMTFTEAKKQKLMSPDSADKLLEAQAATGHIIDPKNNEKLTVEEACSKGVVDIRDRDKLLAAEAAAVGYRDPTSAKPLSVFEAMKKGLIENKTGLRFLQAQESAGGILDPIRSVFLPKDEAIKRNLLDENTRNALKQSPKSYINPETEDDVTYEDLKEKCTTEPKTGQKLLKVSEKLDPSKLMFDGVRKPVTAEELLDCGILDKPTFNKLIKGEKTVPEVAEEKKVFLKGTGSIAGVEAGPSKAMSFTEAKKQKLMSPDSADKLLEAQAATGHILDPENNQELTVEEACSKGVVDIRDRDKLLAAEAAAVGYRDPTSAKPLSVFEAMKKGLIDSKTGLCLLQAQESVGGILDPIRSVFLPKDEAIKRNLLDEKTRDALKQSPKSYIDPETEHDVTYEDLKEKCTTDSKTGQKLLKVSEKLDPSKLIFDGVRKPVTAEELLDCGILDKLTFNKLIKGEKTVPEVAEEKKVFLKGTGSIAGVEAGPSKTMSFTEAKKQKLMPPDSADKLLEAQAATGHIIDPENNQELTVEEACSKGVVDIRDRDKLLAAEAAAVGYRDPTSAKPLSVFEAMKKGLIDIKTGLRLLQAQESVGGILDPIRSVFLPKDEAIKHNLLDEKTRNALKQSPKSYIDPETEHGVSYEDLKAKCTTDPKTGQKLLKVSKKLDPSKLIFDGVRKPVTAEELLDCGILDKPTFNKLIKGEKTVPEVAKEKKVFLKGTGSIAGVEAGPSKAMSFTEAKKQKLMSPESADKLLEAQAATGHIIDPKNNQELTVEEACSKGVVDVRDRDKLLAAEAAAVGYRVPTSAKPLSVFEAMKKGLIDSKTGLRLLQAQESAGGILDPIHSVFLPKDEAIKRNLLDEKTCNALKQSPKSYIDPETEHDVTYEDLKEKCTTEPKTGQKLLKVSEKLDPSKLIFDGVRKPVTAEELLDCGILDKPTFNKLIKGEKTVPEVAEEKKIFLKGTGSIAGVEAGPSKTMSFTEAKKQNLMPPDSADKLLEAQAATGHIIDPENNQGLTVEEACSKGVVDIRDRDKLLAAEAAAVGYRDPTSAKPLSVFEAMKKGLIDSKTGLRLLQAQESVGGILDPIRSVFLPKDEAIKHNLLDEKTRNALKQSPKSYIDPETEHDVSYEDLKAKCTTDPKTGQKLLKVSKKLDPSKLIFDGVRKPVTAEELLDCGILDKPTFNKLIKGEKTVPEVAKEKKVFLKGTGSIAGMEAGPSKAMSFTEAKKQKLMSPESADKLLEAQAATGHIIDPKNNQELTVEEACSKGVVDVRDRDKLLAAEAAAVGYRVPTSAKPLSVFEAMKKGLIDSKTGLRLLQAQESVGGILDPIRSVFLPKDEAIKHNLLDEKTRNALKQSPKSYIDPETEHDVSYEDLKAKCTTDPKTGQKLLKVSKKLDPSKLIFDGVRKPVTAEELLDCGILDKPTFNKLIKGEKTVPEVAKEKKVFLKGAGSIAGMEAGPSKAMSFTEAKKQKLMSPESADKLLEAQAATGHIIDPKNNQELTVEEACSKGVVDVRDRDKLLAAEAAAVGYRVPTSAKPLSVFEAMKKGLIDSKTGLRLLQAQESAGGILDPIHSVFLPKDEAIKRNLLDEKTCNALKQSPKSYIDPETEHDVTYEDLKEKCTTDPKTGQKLLKVSDKINPANLIFDGVRKPVTAEELLDCGILDKPTFNKLIKGEKTVQEVSEEKKVFLKGTGSIAGVEAGPYGAISFTEAKKRKILSPDSADMLLEAQAATGYIIDPKNNQKLTVEDACSKGLVDIRDRDKLLAAEAAAVGYKDPTSPKPLSVFEAMKKGIINNKTALRLLQAQESSGGIVDPNLSVFFPKNEAIKRSLLDENTHKTLKQSPKCYIDPETEHDVTYEDLKQKCTTDPKTGQKLLQVTDKIDPSKLIFEALRKPVTAQQLLDCEILDKPTFNQLTKGQKSVPEVSEEKKDYLKGTGSIAGVVAGPSKKMSFTEAKKQKLMSPDSADKLLEAQAATGHIIDPQNNQKLTVEEACAKRVVDVRDRDKLLAAEAAAVGYKDPTSAKPLSIFEAMKKGLIDNKTALRLLQAQESVGGILDPELSLFLPKDTAIKRKLLDDKTQNALKQSPKCYIDPETEHDISYEDLKKKCTTDPHTGQKLLHVPEKIDPSKVTFEAVRKPVTAEELLDCGILDKQTFNKVTKGEKAVPEISKEKKDFLQGTGSIAGVIAGGSRIMSLTEAKKQKIISPDSADLLLQAQAATGYIIDPKNNQKLTVEDACTRGVVDIRDRDKLLAAEAAAVGYKDPTSAKPLSVFEAMKKGLIDNKTGLRLLQAQESSGGILDPILSVYLPHDTAVKRKLLDENTKKSLKQSPKCYIDPETEQDVSYVALKEKCTTDVHTGQKLLQVSEKIDPSKLVFDGVCKPVTAEQLLDYGVLDKPTLNQLRKGEKSIQTFSEEKKVYLKGTGSIAGVVAGQSRIMSFTEAKKQKILSPESADMLLEAQAATGQIIDPRNNQRLTVTQACTKGLVDVRDRDKLLAAEAAAVGYKHPTSAKPLSVFEATKKGIIDSKTALRLLQAQESVGGILDPNLSVFLPKDEAIKHNLLDENIRKALKESPKCYIDPETENHVSYEDLKKKCLTDPKTGQKLLQVCEKIDPSKLIFDGIRKPVTAEQLLNCGLLDISTFNQLINGEKTVQEVSVKIKDFLQGTATVGGVAAGPSRIISLTEAKKQKVLSPDSVDLLLEAQAATGQIFDTKTNQKLTIEEACTRGILDMKDRNKLLVAEAAAVGYKDPTSSKLLSVFEAMKKGIIDSQTGLRLLQAQVYVGGILDPNFSVFLPTDAAIKRNILDESTWIILRKNPKCYIDPFSGQDISYMALMEKCQTDPHTGQKVFKAWVESDSSKLIFDGIHNPVTAQQLLDCGILDKSTFNQLMKGEKTVKEVSIDKQVFLKGTGSIAGIAGGPLKKMSFQEAKKQNIISPESACMLMEAQAATGQIIDPTTKQKLTVKEACAIRGLDDKDKSRLVVAEAAATGFKDPHSANILSAGQAMRKGLIDKQTTLRLLQAQEAAGGILDPVLGVFLPKDVARHRNLIDEDLYQALNQCPECYVDPDTQQLTSYVSLKKKCKVDQSTGLLLLPEPENLKKVTVQGLRSQVSVTDLVDANLLKQSDVELLMSGKLTSQDVEDRLRSYLRGSACIAGVYDEASDKVMPLYHAMKAGLLRPGTTLELLEAQAASGFIIDPVNNDYLTVSDAYSKKLFGPEFKDKLLSAERAVTGYKLRGTDEVLSLFEAIERGVIEKGHGIRLLEAQIASGGIIDPKHSHRIDVEVAYQKGYFNEEMNEILTYEGDDTKGFFDPNTQENLTYLELQKRCIADKKTGLTLLPILDKKKHESTLKNTLRKRRVIIVDPETNREMTVHEAYSKGYIDHETFLELSQQECEWEEITITDPDGSTRLVIVDRKTGREYEISELLERGVIDQTILDQYRSRTITLTQFADIISDKTKFGSMSATKSSIAPSTSSLTSSTFISSSASIGTSSPVFTSGDSASMGTSTMTSSQFTSSNQASSVTPSMTSSSSVVSRSLSPTLTKMTTMKTTTVREQSTSFSTVGQDSPDSRKHISSISISLASPVETVGEQNPVGAIFDTETLEKISITEALNRGLLDLISAQRLLEAQACTGGIIDPATGRKVSIQEASRLGLITGDMATKLKPAQKAYFGFEDVKTRKKLSAAEAIKEMWLPYEAGQRFMEYQFVTGGLYDPEMGCRRNIEDALRMGWLDGRTAQKLQDTKNHTKNLTCPKSKLKISYKEALDSCLVEEDTGVKMLQASSVSSRGISSPYNVSSAPGSATGSRSGSRRSSRRSSVDLGSPSSTVVTRFTYSSFSSFSSHR
uniref:Uncharacterized protein n=1 Tax=Sphaeramia orbicularis TaxID=375764 RepID=A0A672YY93_9TELE